MKDMGTTIRFRTSDTVDITYNFLPKHRYRIDYKKLKSGSMEFYITDITRNNTDVGAFYDNLYVRKHGGFVLDIHHARYPVRYEGGG